jgi:hypothetical protein
MNFVFTSIEDLEVEHISFLETKKNNIIDGNFTKIIYNDEFTTLNGIFIFVPPLFFEEMPKIENMHQTEEEKAFFYYKRKEINDDDTYEDYNSDNDTAFTQSEKDKFLNLENNILNLYKQIFNIKKKKKLTLKTQILNNSFKIYKGTFIKHTKKVFHNNEPREEVALSSTNKTSIVLKISGIWENEFEIGITFKFFEMKLFE